MCEALDDEVVGALIGSSEERAQGHLIYLYFFDGRKSSFMNHFVGAGKAPDDASLCPLSPVA